MSDCIKQSRIKPTLAYTTFRNGLEGLGLRYRLIYVFNDMITTNETYMSLYSFIVRQNNLENTKDHCGSIYNQLMNGNTRNDIETYCSYLIYSYDISFFSKYSLEQTTTPPPHYYSKEQSEKTKAAISSETGGTDDQSKDNGIENQMISMLMGNTKDFLANYEGQIEIINESPIDYNDEGYGLYPEDYFCLYYRYNWKEKKIIKFKDHEKRRNRLYVDACIMRRIKPDITFQELLYNLVLRRQRYYDNSDGVLTNKFLIEKTYQVLNLESSKILSFAPSRHGLYRVDKDYCQKIGMTPRSYSRVVAGKIRQQGIAKWYD